MLQIVNNVHPVILAYRPGLPSDFSVTEFKHAAVIVAPNGDRMLIRERAGRLGWEISESRAAVSPEWTRNAETVERRVSEWAADRIPERRTCDYCGAEGGQFEVHVFRLVDEDGDPGLFYVCATCAPEYEDHGEWLA